MVESRKGLSKQPQAHPADEQRPDHELAKPGAPVEGQAGTQETVTLSVRTRESLRRRLRVHALQTGRTVQDVVDDAICQYLDHHARSPSDP